MSHTSTHHPIFVNDLVLSFAYPFKWSVVSSFEVLPILSSFASLLNRSAVWNLSDPLWHSFNSSGGSVLLISSSVIPYSQVHVNSFHFLSECCPNYAILVPCFSFLPVCFHINFDPLSSCFMSFNLQGSRNVPCSSCWTECFKFCSPPSCHFFKLCDLSRFFGFTRLSKK